jgi:S1-C subfamily serine protease
MPVANAISTGGRVRAQSPDGPLNRIAPNSAGHGRWNPSDASMGSFADTGQSAAATMPAAQQEAGAGDPFRRARIDTVSHDAAAPQSTADNSTQQSGQDLIKYCARLKIEDRDGSSYGTGTIIDVRGDQALILTCGHIFRDSKGDGTVLVDLFVPGAPKKIPGRVVGYDMDRDVGLVSIRPGIKLTPAVVAPEGFELKQGDQLITVGCNNGSDPTVEHTHVLATNKFVGPPNVQVAGQPVQGRSGGGLFTAQGMVVGVCNAADPTDNAGLFAAAAAIHAQLDAARLSSIYRSQLANPAYANADARGNNATTNHLAQPARASAPAIPNAAELARTAGAGDNRVTLASLTQQAGDAEVICIICPRGNPQAKSEVVVLDRASSAFMQQLAAERQTQQARRLTSHETRTPPRDKWRGAR